MPRELAPKPQTDMDLAKEAERIGGKVECDLYPAYEVAMEWGRANGVRGLVTKKKYRSRGEVIVDEIPVVSVRVTMSPADFFALRFKQKDCARNVAIVPPTVADHQEVTNTPAYQPAEHRLRTDQTEPKRAPNNAAKADARPSLTEAFAATKQGRADARPEEKGS